ncbi:MAG: ribonuclease P protein component [Salinivenus sp.]
MPDRPDQRAPDRRYTFPRSHRLKRRRLIRSLFDRRRDDVDTVAVGCVRLLFRIVDREALGADVPVQVGFAPGRRAKPGVERTRVRRLLREAYRVHQHTLSDLFGGRPDALIVMILFRGDPARPEAIWDDLPRALQRAARHPALEDAASSDPPPASDGP